MDSMILKGRRIFIVEDNIANRAIMQMLLESNGARTAIERWGTDVIQRLRAFAPVDVILLDLMFPNEVTGYEIFDAIRAEGEFSDIPIVAVSATDPVAAIPHCQKQGFSGFIAKPIHFETFTLQINQVLQGKEVWYSTDLDEFDHEGITHE